MATSITSSRWCGRTSPDRSALSDQLANLLPNAPRTAAKYSNAGAAQRACNGLEYVPQVGRAARHASCAEFGTMRSSDQENVYEVTTSA
jgi:hypothetical protein